MQMQFGFAVKVLGDPALKSHDARRWQSAPHLSVSIGCLRAILDYLDDNDIRMYRISSDFAPYLTHPDMPQFHGQIDECLDELAELGEIAHDYGIRLSFHPSQYVVLNSPDERIAEQSVRDFEWQARVLDIMGQGPEGVVVTHVGGVYDDKHAAIQRFIDRFEQLPENVTRRLVLENDESSYSVADVLHISGRTGIRVIFDYLHHSCYDPEGLGAREALRYSLDTWPADQTPKIHFSSPRTEMREQKRKSPVTGKMEIVYLPPLLTQHSDYVNPFEFSMFMEKTKGLRDFDVMLEAKSKDLALLRLREHLGRREQPLGVIP